MCDPFDPFEARFRFDDHGRRVLAGLTHEETTEFEALDGLPPYGGQPVWPDGDLPILPVETRWLALWDKHERAVFAEAAQPV